MARPIPLTADPDNPASPAGAIPVDLFGVEGGGGGGGVRTYGPLELEDNLGNLDYIWAQVYRVEDIVFFYVEGEDSGLEIGTKLANLPEGLSPSVYITHLGAAEGSGDDGVGSVRVVPDQEFPRLEVGTVLVGEGLTRVSVGGWYFTDDPFPESD